jgi:hypothetical protein
MECVTPSAGSVHPLSLRYVLQGGALNGQGVRSKSAFNGGKDLSSVNEALDLDLIFLSVV